MYSNAVFKYFLMYLNTLNSENVNKLSACLLVYKSCVSWCSVHRTSIEPVPACVLVNCITPLLYSLYSMSTLLIYGSYFCINIYSVNI